MGISTYILFIYVVNRLVAVQVTIVCLVLACMHIDTLDNIRFDKVLKVGRGGLWHRHKLKGAGIPVFDVHEYCLFHIVLLVDMLVLFTSAHVHHIRLDLAGYLVRISKVRYVSFSLYSRNYAELCVIPRSRCNCICDVPLCLLVNICVAMTYFR